MKYGIDEQQIRTWWQIFKAPNRLAEIRLLSGKNIYSGYFKSADSLITNIRCYLESSDSRNSTLQAYCIFNDIDEALYSREQHEKFVYGTKTTKDDDITHRNFVLIDLDPERPSGISSSNDEFEKAHRKAADIYRFLIANGFFEPIICVSGNGYHIYVPCDMPNDDVHHELVNDFLKSLGHMFADGNVGVDQSVGNAANLTKLMGTWAKKGADTEDRSWRPARFVKIPQEIRKNDELLFRKIADLLPKENPQPSQPHINTQYKESFDLVTWLNRYGISYKEEKQGTSTRFTLEYCPWVETHSDHKKWDSALFLDPNGKITFNCTHSHCQGKTWQDFRLYYEPDAYSRTFEPRQQRQYAPPPPRYEIKEEVPELGQKWLSMSSIQKVNLSDMENIKTGIHELDKSIEGLYLTEVSLLSGSNSSGKSSFLNTLILNIIQQGYKVALWSGELPAFVLKSWIQMVAAGKERLLPSKKNPGRFYVPDNIGEHIDRWMDGKFFLYNNEYGAKWQQIFHDMETLLKVGVKMFILDNLFSLDINILDGDKNNKQRELIIQIKEFAKRNKVHIILVAHPRKVMTFLRKNDISGSSDLTNAVDNVFIAHRVNNDFFKAGAEFFGNIQIQQFQNFGNVIEVAKNRMYGVVDFMVGMHYEVETRRFKNTQDEDIRYGWEDEPTQITMSFSQPVQQKDNGMPFEPPTNEDVPF